MTVQPSGQPPVIYPYLARLFWLLWRDPEASARELGEELGVKAGSIHRYRNQLRRILIQNGGDVYPCPECYRLAVRPDGSGSLVCRSCGLVVEEGASAVHRLPWDETFAWVSHLAFGKSLGDTLPVRQLYRVIAVNGGEDLPLRAKVLKAIVQAVDPPTVKTLLEYGSQMMKGLGLDADTPRNHLIADELGRLLRKIGAIYYVGGFKVELPRIAAAALYATLQRLHPSMVEEARGRYPFEPRHYAWVALVEYLESRPDRRNQPREGLPNY